MFCPAPTTLQPTALQATAPRRTVRRWLALLMLCALPAQGTGASELKRLALAIGNAPPAVRIDFATIAIYETAAAYAEEAQRARQEPDPAQRRDVARWANAVDRYATDLWTIVDTISEVTEIDVRVSAASDVELGVDGTTVLLSGPQPQLESAFEQRILERFCELQPCSELLADFQGPTTTAAAPGSAMRWTFSERSGPVCSNADGLEFQFRDTQNLAQKRQACEQIIAELNHLTTQITQHKESGTRIEWNHLAIHAMKENPQQRVELNSDGDSLVTSVPALAATKRLFVLVKPWLAARVNGTSLHQVVINADALMAPLFSPS
jgi:hypothetical protein